MLKSKASNYSVVFQNGPRIGREQKWVLCESLWSGMIVSGALKGIMYTTEIDTGRTTWRTQINAVLWTERKPNTSLPWWSTRIFPPWHQNGFLSKKSSVDVRFKFWKPSAVNSAPHEVPGDAVSACAKYAWQRYGSAACRVFAVKGKSALFSRTGRLSSYFSKVCSWVVRMVLRQDLESTVF